MEENTLKIWGERRRILLDDKNEIDLLYLKKGYFCSTHYHHYKINKFILVLGEVEIQTEFGGKKLIPGDPFEVPPNQTHRFYAKQPSVMIEIAYIITDGKIDPNDIVRITQGGRMIKGKEVTLDEMNKKGLSNT